MREHVAIGRALEDGEVAETCLHDTLEDALLPEPASVDHDLFAAVRVRVLVRISLAGTRCRTYPMSWYA